ncbi:MAG: carboxypeptidase-like regulatory domain-containing protein [Aureispira sp.]|nr:carboxypeptidase-like regulatory domain-containing protein [Aureispira sp.]
MHIIKLLIYCCLISPFILTAQEYKIEGQVVDQQSKKGLAFVNLLFNDDAQLGETTDIDGYFEFSSDQAIKTFTLSYVGYQTKTFGLDSLPQPLVLGLQKASLKIDEVVVVAGENPAYRIIRKTIKNRKKHNPELVKSFQYNCHNKLRSEIIGLPDSVLFPNIYLIMMESLTQRKFKFPDKDQEVILANRMSGMKNPMIAALATDFQPFSFYEENIIIADKEFRNPISPGCITKYEYRLEDTLYQGKDSIYVISFFPRKGKTFDAFKGVLYINTNGYAIQNVLAENAVKFSLLDVKFEQFYAYVDSSQWFPIQLNFELRVPMPSFPGNSALKLEGRSYLDSILIDPPLRTRDFGPTNVIIDRKATRQDSSFWNKYRQRKLNSKEEFSYQFVDSLGKKFKLDFLVGITEDLPIGRLTLGPMALDYSKIVDANEFEGSRVGLGLYTSSKLSKHFSVGGYFGYGFGDKEWKYGGSLLLKPLLKKDFAIEMSYAQDVVEPASIIETPQVSSKWVTPAQTFARRYVLNQMDYVERIEAAVYWRMFRHVQVRTFVSRKTIDPGYTYTFEDSNGDMSQFTTFEVGGQLRFTYKERIVQMGAHNVIAKTKFPVLYLQYNKGIAGVWDAEFDYHKLTLGLESSFFIKSVGRTSINLKGGWIIGDLPYPLLFNGRGSFSRTRPFLINNTFQTARVNEFAADRFVYLFFKHDFGSLLFKIKKFQPEFAIYQGIGFGWLSNIEKHKGLDLKVMNKGYFESGLMINNLIKLKLFKALYFGIGGGMFYRYGVYHLPDKLWDNFAYRVSVNISF